MPKKGFVKTKEEIEIIASGGRILGEVLAATAERAVAGVSTWELNLFAEKEIRKHGGRPSFKGYGDSSNMYPAGLCTSINDVVVHGIPSKKRILRDGDIIGLDIGMEYKGLYTDTALTIPVGHADERALHLIATAEKCLKAAIENAKPGNRIGDISYAIQRNAEEEGFSVVRDLIGHGVGYAVHEEPAVPCFGKAGTGMQIVPGMVLAIEPMLCEKKHHVIFDSDGWTVRTADGGRSSHAEHTVAITENGARILTLRPHKVRVSDIV